MVKITNKSSLGSSFLRFKEVKRPWIQSLKTFDVKVLIQLSFIVKDGTFILPRANCQLPSHKCQTPEEYLWSLRSVSHQLISKLWSSSLENQKLGHGLSQGCRIRQRPSINSPSPKLSLVLLWKGQLWLGDHVREGQAHGKSHRHSQCSESPPTEFLSHSHTDEDCTKEQASSKSNRPQLCSAEIVQEPIYQDLCLFGSPVETAQLGRQVMSKTW
jgi:hypothetical protein